MTKKNEYGCTEREEAMIRAYLTDHDRNQQRAYRAAYNAQRMSNRAVAVEASRILAKPHIKARIDAILRKTAEKTELLTEEFVQREYLCIAKANPAQFFDIAEQDGKRLMIFKDPNLITADMWAAVQEFTLLPDGSVKIKLHEKRGALRDIALMLDMFPRLGKAPRSVGAGSDAPASDANMRHSRILQELSDIFGAAAQAALPAPQEA